MKRILVTGAAGAFGPSVVASFSKVPDCLVFKTDLKCNSGAEYFPCDLRVRTQVEELLHAVMPDLVIHLTGTICRDYDEAMAVNVHAAKALLETVEKNHMKTRIVLIGSAAEYGIVTPEENPVQETHRLAPITIYGLTKAYQSLLANVFVHRGADVVVARIFNLDGDGLTDQLVVGRFQKQIKALKSGEIDRIRLGPLSAVRDYVSFEAAASQIRAIACHGIAGNMYHVASGKPMSVRELLQIYLSRNGLDMSCVQEDTQYSNHAGYDVPVIYADTSKTGKLLSMMQQNAS